MEWCRGYESRCERCEVCARQHLRVVVLDDEVQEDCHNADDVDVDGVWVGLQRGGCTLLEEIF